MDDESDINEEYLKEEVETLMINETILNAEIEEHNTGKDILETHLRKLKLKLKYFDKTIEEYSTVKAQRDRDKKDGIDTTKLEIKLEDLRQKGIVTNEDPKYKEINERVERNKAKIETINGFLTTKTEKLVATKVALEKIERERLKDWEMFQQEVADERVKRENEVKQTISETQTICTLLPSTEGMESDLRNQDEPVKGAVQGTPNVNTDVVVTNKLKDAMGSDLRNQDEPVKGAVQGTPNVNTDVVVTNKLKDAMGSDLRNQDEPEEGAAQGTLNVNTDVLADNNIRKNVLDACQKKTRKWNRSKMMIVGEGRSGKTALANSMIGKTFCDTESTIGINNFSCSIHYADVSKGQWNIFERPEKELETAIAMSIRERQIDNNVVHQTDKIDSNNIKITDKVDTTFTVNIAKPKINDTRSEHTTNKSCYDVFLSALNSHLPRKKVIPINEDMTFFPLFDHIRNTPEPLAITTVSPKVEEIDNDFVAKCLADNIQTSSDLIISLFDFGGQSVFDVIHHLFLTPFGVYIVVFNMMWLAEGETETDRASCWARLEGWVNSIVMHTSEGSDNGFVNHNSPKSAPIVFVGTCKDKVIESVSDVRSFLQAISNNLKSKINICNIPVVWNNEEDLWFFPVDNVMGRGDSSLMAMLQSIEEVMKQSGHVTQEKPLIWLQALDKLKARKDVVSYSMTEVREMLAFCGIEESGVSDVLLFFNKMGELLWIDEDGLRDTIVMDPISFFVAPATRVICKHIELEERGETFCHEANILRECKFKFSDECESMVTTGIVNGLLLQALVGAQCEVIVSLMIKFGLIVAVLNPEETRDFRVSANEKQYIVPSLLQPRSILDQKQRQAPLSSIEPNELKSSVYFSFYLHNSTIWNAPLSDSQLASEGYLPQGLFLRFLGKLLTWSQLITPGYDALSDKLFNNDVTILFGRRTFRIRVFEDYNTICVTVTRGSNYAGLLLRLKGILTNVIKECFGLLHFKVFLIHLDTESLATTVPNFYIPFDLVDMAHREKHSVILSNSLSLERIELKDCYAKWWELHDTSQDCDVFISYRWGETDSKFASLIYDSLLDIDYSYVFYDAHVMEVGDNLQDTFAKALITAKVFVPFCSHEALVKMMDHNAQTVDNVLLEWILALECQKKGTLNILPIPYGSINETTFFLDFDRQGINLLPDVFPTKTIEKANGYLKLFQIPPSAELHSLTVRDVVNNILGFKYSFYASEFKRLKDCIPSCISSIRSVHTSRTDTCNPLSPGAQVTMSPTLTHSRNSPKRIMSSYFFGSPTLTKRKTETTINVEEAWSILHDSNLLIDQGNAAALRDFLARLGVYKSSDLMVCDDNDIFEMSNKLKKVPKINFLRALGKL